MPLSGFSKCNPEMVELLPLNQKADIDFVETLLREFQANTGSEIAKELLAVWPKPACRFIKVRN